MQLDEMYNVADSHTKSLFGNKIQINALPYNRDWLANQRLHEIALRHDAHCEYVKNSGGGHYHTEVIYDDFVITVSQVKTYREFVRPARFREKLIENYNLDLFEDVKSMVIEEKKKIYAVILHGPVSSSIQKPAFARLAIPNPLLNNYDLNICLYKYCGLDQPTMAKEPRVEQIAENNQPKLKSGTSN
jgi:hypothetical protein